VNITYVSFTELQDAVFDQLEQVYPLSALYPENMSSLVFFDKLHPTAQLHGLAAAYIVDALNGASSGDIVPLLSPDLALRSSIGSKGEVDKLVFLLAANTTYTFEMLGISSGKLGDLASWQVLADPLLSLSSPGGTFLAKNDDGGMGLDARITFTTTSAGLYSLQLSAVGNLTGTYRLQAENSTVQNDNYRVTSSSTLVVEGLGGGNDRIYASVSYMLAAGSSIETLSTSSNSGTAALTLTGNELSQTIVGNAGQNLLSGGGGNDILRGERGDDTLTGGAGNDRFVIRELGGTDTITDMVRGQDLIDLRALDANSALSSNQAFAFIGAAAFTKTAGQLRTYVSNEINYAAGDVNGDGLADFVINLGSVQTQASDFLL
jgi:Ca2+-binding RTX toxin-like protein